MREALGLETGDRVLAWSPLVGGGAVAATAAGLHVMTPRGRLDVRPWVDVDHAAWDQASRTLAVWWVGRRQATPLEVEDLDGPLPETVRERVQASVIHSVSVPLPGGRTARIALRRRADGSVQEQMLLPPGVRADDPRIAPVMTGALRELREDAGLAGPAGPAGFGSLGRADPP